MKIPDGYVAICQCGQAIGALDRTRMRSKDVGVLPSQWLTQGCDIKCKWGTFVQEITSCKCKPEAVEVEIKEKEGKG